MPSTVKWVAANRVSTKMVNTSWSSFLRRSDTWVTNWSKRYCCFSGSGVLKIWVFGGRWVWGIGKIVKLWEWEGLFVFIGT